MQLTVHLEWYNNHRNCSQSLFWFLIFLKFLPLKNKATKAKRAIIKNGCCFVVKGWLERPLNLDNLVKPEYTIVTIAIITTNRQIIKIICCSPLLFMLSSFIIHAVLLPTITCILPTLYLSPHFYSFRAICTDIDVFPALQNLAAEVFKIGVMP